MCGREQQVSGTPWTSLRKVVGDVLPDLSQVWVCSKCVTCSSSAMAFEPTRYCPCALLLWSHKGSLILAGRSGFLQDAHLEKLCCVAVERQPHTCCGSVLFPFKWFNSSQWHMECRSDDRLSHTFKDMPVVKCFNKVSFRCFFFCHFKHTHMLTHARTPAN